METVKIEYSVSTDKVGSKVPGIVEIDKEDFDNMTEDELEKVMFEEMLDSSKWDWNFEVLEE